ncbi:MAG TPA: hypothetical protein VMR52_07360 [Dehalococcoidia bacterium]|nr:hypothetical protein [Dehalococcoidia bacterium]
MDDQITRRIDKDVLARVAASSKATQRWLKTALHTIRTMPPAREEQDVYVPPPSWPPMGRRAPAPTYEPPAEQRQPPDLDDMLTGRANLQEQLEAHPELAHELEGLSDIIDMLKDVGKKRREMGEDALKDKLRRAGDEDEDSDQDVFG